MTTLPPIIHVVDDDASFCAALGELLSACGYRVALYKSAEQLLKTLPGGDHGCIAASPASRSLMRWHNGTNHQNASSQCDAKISGPVSCGACSGRGTSWVTVGLGPPRRRRCRASGEKIETNNL